MYFDYGVPAVITLRYISETWLCTESQIESICAEQSTSWKHIFSLLGMSVRSLEFSVTKVGKFCSKGTADELEQQGNNANLNLLNKAPFNDSAFACSFPSLHTGIQLP